MPEAIWISFAFVTGLLVKGIGLPPLVGYLAAGFVLSGLAANTSITAEPTDVLAHIAHLGVLLLLFTVGLKLKLRSIISPEVIGGSLLHFAITCVVFAPGLYLLFDLDWTTALMLAIALSFSSTVLAAKVLESKRELRAFHGRVAIGILIMQDLIALVVMSLAAGKTPSEWALIVFGLPLLRPLLYKLLDASGHDELLVLLGLLLALVVGGLGFEADLSCSFDETTSSRAGYTERVLRVRGEIVDVYGSRVGIPDRADSHTQIHAVAVFLDLFEFLATRQASGNLT